MKCGISVVHLLIYQCLRLRDCSQECWAHTGPLPYRLSPVTSLGTKLVGRRWTLYSYSNMWDFLEEVVALWWMGLKQLLISLVSESSQVIQVVSHVPPSIDS